MAFYKDIVNFLFPIPPIILMRQNEFPNCPLIFEHISKNPPNPKKLGRVYYRLCNLSGFSWLIWIFNIILFFAIVITFLFSWGCNIDLSSPYYFGIFSCKMLIAIFTAILFIGQIFYHTSNVISLQLSDLCYDLISPISSNAGNSITADESGHNDNQ